MMKTKKIAIIGNPTSNISSSKFLVKLANILQKIAYDIYIINDGLVKSNASNIRIISATCLISRLKQKKSFFSSIIAFVMSQFFFSIALIKIIRKIDYVIVLPVVFSAPVMISKLCRKKIIIYEAQDIFSINFSDNIVDKYKYSFLMIHRNISLNLAHKILVEGYSLLSKNNLISYHKKIRQCNVYVDLLHYHVIKRYDTRNFIVGFIASLEDRKGIRQYVQAIRLVHQQNKKITFMIVGNGPLYIEIKRSLLDLINDGVVKLYPFINEKDLPRIYNELRLFVLPSISEGLPNSILEAIACGTPVLATNVGAIPDIIIDGVTGFLINDNSPETIAKNIMLALTYHNIERVIVNARKIIENNFSYISAIDKFNSILGDL